MGDVEISEALRDAVASRMDELEMSPTDFEEATGLSDTALLNLRRGEIRRYQKRLTVPVCRALGWTSDSIDRIMRGEEPLPALAVSPSDVPDDRVLARLAVSQAVEELEEGYRLLKAELAEVQDRLAVLEGRNLASGG